jgi:MFS family permease
VSQHLDTVETDIPARMDRLPWSRWHWMVVFALGITWLLDGLEVTIVGAIAAVLVKPQTLGLSAGEIGLAGSVYVAGNVVGAVMFGYMTDRLGRKRLFQWTLIIYLVATVLTAFSWNALSFLVFRFITGLGIGGEYTAINSATEELNPARVRGMVELAINGSWWLGTAVGAVSSLILLNPKIVAVTLGWRLAFALGAILAVAVLMIRRLLPESPRWLMSHGHVDEAEKIVAEIEDQVRGYTGQKDLPDYEGTIEITQRERTPLGEIFSAMFKDNLSRTVLGIGLMIGQTFFYNAVFFTFGLTLTTFFKVPAGDIGYYIFAFAVGNFLGPLTLGRLFDVVGRKPMIAGTYIASGALLAITGFLFKNGSLSDVSITAWWSAAFFFASAGASAAYLTVSEIFPLEIRAVAIAFFYAIGSAIGGIAGPIIFAAEVGSKDPSQVLVGYLIAAALMIGGGAMELFLGVAAEQETLEDVSEPLGAKEADRQS